MNLLVHIIHAEFKPGWEDRHLGQYAGMCRALSICRISSFGISLGIFLWSVWNASWKAQDIGNCITGRLEDHRPMNHHLSPNHTKPEAKSRNLARILANAPESGAPAGHQHQHQHHQHQLWRGPMRPSWASNNQKTVPSETIAIGGPFVCGRTVVAISRPPCQRSVRLLTPKANSCPRI